MYKKSLIIPGPAGALEAIWQEPQSMEYPRQAAPGSLASQQQQAAQQAQYLAQQPAAKRLTRVGVVCHPHPLYHGTMHNKVVTTIVKALNQMGIATVHFNFRGVGNSEGEFAHTIGETEDCLAVVQWVLTQWPEVELWLAGFSFGSYIAAKAASWLTADNQLTSTNQVNLAQLISIAPPVQHNDFTAIEVRCPWLIIQADDDEVVAAEQVYNWYDGLTVNKSLIRFAKAGHFFHGQLNNLMENMQAHYGQHRF